MALVYIEKNTGAYGDASDLVITTDAALDGALDEEVSDSEVFEVAQNMLNADTGISMEDVVSLLQEVQDGIGDWRGTLDYVIQQLSD